MKKILTLLFCITFFFIENSPAIAQNNLSFPEDRAKVDSMLVLMSENGPFKSIEKGKKALALAQRINYKIGEAKTLQKLGHSYTVKHKYKEAIESLKQAKELFFQHGTDTDKLNILNDFARTYIFFNYHKEALDLSNEMLVLAEQLQDSLFIGHSLWNSARVKLKINKREEFLKLGKQAISIYKKIDNTDELINAYMYLGKTFTETDSMFYYFSKVQSLLPLIKNIEHQQYIEYSVNETLARTYALNKDYKKAEPAVQKALGIARRRANPEETAIMQYYLSEVYFYHYKNYEKAIALADSSLQYEKSIGRYYYVIPEAQYLSEIHVANNQLHKALDYAKLAMLYQDSLYWANRRNDAAYIERENAIEQQVTEILMLENQRRTRTILGAAIAVVLLLALGFFYRQHQLKSKYLKVQEDFSRQLQQDKETIEQQKLTLENTNATKDRLMAIIGHDLRGPLYNLQGLEDQVNYLLETGQLQRLKELGTRMDNSTQQLTSTLNNILSWSMQQMGNFPYEPENIKLEDVVEQNLAFFEGVIRFKEVKIKVDIEVSLSCFMDRNALNSILRNLISNAIKFSNKNGMITIQSNKHNGKVRLRVADKGTGMPADKIEQIRNGVVSKGKKGTSGEKSTGLGWSLVRELIHQNNGTFEINSEEHQGTQIDVYLPLI